ncbi:MAG: hypothetical protein GWP91_07275 [Rhodobacterales bacterium]|nr:hypothetical protein [Rhodobacterales bacterium]
MWTWIRALLQGWGLLSPVDPSQLSAADVMAELRAGKRKPAEESEWQSAVRRFNIKVFSNADRKRVWRQYRRKFSGELSNWDEIVAPTREDQACLDQILAELAR